MTMEPAVGTTETLAWRFCTISLTVMRSPFQSLAVSLAISSPTFLGDRPRGPILGAREEAAPTSPTKEKIPNQALRPDGRMYAARTSSHPDEHLHNLYDTRIELAQMPTENART